MTKYRLFLLLLLLLSIGTRISAQEAPSRPDLGDGEVIYSGLNSPQGLYFDDEGNLYILDSGLGGDEEVVSFDVNTYEPLSATFGYSAQIIQVAPDGTTSVVANLPSINTTEEFGGPARVVRVGDALYATIGIWHSSQGDEVTLPFQAQVIRIASDGTFETVADLWAHELAFNPDGTDNVESHPYGIAASETLLYIVDAAGNSLLALDLETNELTTVVGFEGMPGVFPNRMREGALVADPVPTAVVVGGDGTIYVSYLSGAPFIAGSAKIVTVTPEGDVADFATGLTMLTDMKMGPDGNLYVTTFAVFSPTGPVANSGAITRVFPDGTSEVVVAGLPLATALAIDAEGNGVVAIYGAAIPNAGTIVRYAGLTEMPAVGQ